MFYDHYFRHGSTPWAYWMGPHRGGHGFGHFGRRFRGGFGRGGMDFRTGRKLGAADLQLVILALLAERPSHGYELIKAVEERSGGFYVPSPGVIYPALTYLEEIGHVTVEPEGTKKLYQITASGRQHLEQNRATVDAMLSELGRIGRKMEHVRRVFAGEEPSAQGDHEHAEGAEEGADFAGGSRELRAARRALKKALFAKWRCSREEAKRIAAILRRAAEEIAGK
jgi:DNA-binding PadR family transcriptional regulator